MTSIETKINKRIQAIDSSLLNDIVNKLKKYNVNFYNSEGEFVFDKFRKDCIKTYNLLFKNDRPVNGIYYQLCDFLSIVQTIVGTRNFNEFMSEKYK